MKVKSFIHSMSKKLFVPLKTGCQLFSFGRLASRVVSARGQQYGFYRTDEERNLSDKDEE